MANGLVELYQKDGPLLSRILDIIQDLKILNPLLESRNFIFANDLASLASRREYLNLQKWLQDSIARHGDEFIQACFEFLQLKVQTELNRQERANFALGVPLGVDTVAIYLRILSNSNLPPDGRRALKEVHNSCLQAYPRLINIGSAEDTGETGAETTFTADIEKEANSHFESMYRGDLSPESMIELLKDLKNSPQPRQQDVFACMVHNLFDEYQFYGKYPDKELYLTSVLFGSIIREKLITQMPLGIALRYVLDALRSSAESKIFSFGINALSQFKNHLPEWPQYCSHLLHIPAIHHFDSEAYNTIKEIVQRNFSAGNAQTATGSGVADKLARSAAGPTKSSSDDTSISQIEPIAAASAARNMKTLRSNSLLESAEARNIEAPAVLTQDKILFILNNLTHHNLQEKLLAIRDYLSESSYAWFASYLVTKRVSIEPNQHELYLQFVTDFDDPNLYQHVLHETFLNVKVQIESEKTVHSSSERALLKNLGNWLGGLTLARNKPIKHKHLAVKDILIGAFETNRLLAVIPFVCKVLEHAAKSNVFMPPNPWTMATIRLLLELYNFADLKLNLKFEIEVLCKALDLEIKDIEPAVILRARPVRQARDELGGLAGEMDRLAIAKAQRPGRQAAAAGGATSQYEDLLAGMPNLMAYISANLNVGVFGKQPAFKRLMCAAIDHAIREIIAPVVERSVAIAAISTRELVLKDFAMEPNEAKLVKAAHLMVQNLAGNLALVTCKEPLRISMVSHFRTLFNQNGFFNRANSARPRPSARFCQRGPDLACSVIERGADGEGPYRKWTKHFALRQDSCAQEAPESSGLRSRL